MTDLQQHKGEIYALCCPDSGEVRYIGKANNSAKRLRSHIRDSARRNTPVYCWMRKLAREGKQPVLRLLCVADDWRAAERQAIAEHLTAGARLLNVADGGDEPYCSPEVRAANGRAVAHQVHGNPVSRRVWELKRALGGAIKAGHVSEATKAKIRAAAILKPALFGQWANI